MNNINITVLKDNVHLDSDYYKNTRRVAGYSYNLQY